MDIDISKLSLDELYKLYGEIVIQLEIASENQRRIRQTIIERRSEVKKPEKPKP